jgi:hypothetical protein
VALAIALGLLGVFAGSPNSPRATIAGTTRQDPGGAALAFTQELAGTSASAGNEKEFGLGPPGQVFVTGPLNSFAPLFGGSVAAALAAYRAAPTSQQAAWANNYLMALDKITPSSMGGEEMETAMSPDYSKIGTLHGDFGPVPALVKADVALAQGGHLEQYLEGRNPGHTLHLVTIWLYDHPKMLNDAVANGLTDDQWGMVKERDYPRRPLVPDHPGDHPRQIPAGCHRHRVRAVEPARRADLHLRASPGARNPQHSPQAAPVPGDRPLPHPRREDHPRPRCLPANGAAAGGAGMTRRRGVGELLLFLAASAIGIYAFSRGLAGFFGHPHADP